ncbi:carboxypeptidase-like regulatory domain-containing protein, partial [Rubrivirga sp.]|uniref:carboxypeptidase-like regulatory domain-containing protein n=1 Tax=Rubrivirga sp. TaxID=1885344 RepID=UPI003C746B54
MLRLWPLAALLLSVAAHAQPATYTLEVAVTDEHSGAPLPGATVVLEGAEIGTSTNAEGRAVLEDVPGGAAVVVVSFVGFETARVGTPVPRDGPLEVALEDDEEALEDVVVDATRTSRTIAALPTRIEVIAGEEIDEKVSMEPSN